MAVRKALSWMEKDRKPRAAVDNQSQQTKFLKSEFRLKQSASRRRRSKNNEMKRTTQKKAILSRLHLQILGPRIEIERRRILELAALHGTECGVGDA